MLKCNVNPGPVYSSFTKVFRLHVGHPGSTGGGYVPGSVSPTFSLSLKKKKCNIN